ncbi:MAG: hypothetical protein SFY70_03930 [Bacteroidia bacterium]|nr:hypothetical protein [Bacteroidia bacterium]
MNPTELKAQVYQTLLGTKRELLAEAQAYLKRQMDDVNRSDADDSQDRMSESADDLFRSVENHRAHLDALAEEIDLLEQLNIHEPEARVSLGALVETDRGWYYVAVSLGSPIRLNGHSVMAVSVRSPWYQAARTHAVGETFAAGGQTYTVLGLY